VGWSWKNQYRVKPTEWLVQGFAWVRFTDRLLPVTIAPSEATGLQKTLQVMRLAQASLKRARHAGALRRRAHDAKKAATVVKKLRL